MKWNSVLSLINGTIQVLPCIYISCILLERSFPMHTQTESLLQKLRQWKQLQTIHIPFYLIIKNIFDHLFVINRKLDTTSDEQAVLQQYYCSKKS